MINSYNSRKPFYPIEFFDNLIKPSLEIDVNQQMDAEEFMGFLLDKLEQEFKTLNLLDKLNNLFKVFSVLLGSNQNRVLVQRVQ